MACARYYVVPDGDVWLLKFNDEEYGPFKSGREVMRFAIDAAEKLGRSGEAAHVRVIGGPLGTEWEFSPGDTEANAGGRLVPGGTDAAH
jgi:hypothetical protein